METYDGINSPLFFNRSKPFANNWLVFNCIDLEIIKKNALVVAEQLIQVKEDIPLSSFFPPNSQIFVNASSNH